METFSALLVLCAGNSAVTGEFPSQRSATRSFAVSLICAWRKSWVNNRDAGDLRRHRAHYDVTVIKGVDFIKSYGHRDADEISLERWRWCQSENCSAKIVKTLVSYINGLVQDCSNSTANTLELLQSCTKPSICFFLIKDGIELFCSSRIMMASWRGNTFRITGPWWRHSRVTARSKGQQCRAFGDFFFASQKMLLNKQLSVI